MAWSISFRRGGKPTRSSGRTAAFTTESGSGESGWKENQTRVRINQQQTGPAELSLCSRRSSYDDSNTNGPQKTIGREKAEFHSVPLRGSLARKDRGAGRSSAGACRSLS